MIRLNTFECILIRFTVIAFDRLERVYIRREHCGIFGYIKRLLRETVGFLHDFSLLYEILSHTREISCQTHVANDMHFHPIENTVYIA